MENIPPENTVVVVSENTLPPLAKSAFNECLDDGLCVICVEKPNKQRLLIHCPCCDYKACSRCVRTYLLSIATPKCMKCGEVWTRPFLFKQFPIVFQRELKLKHIQTKYEREIALLPLAQSVLEHQKKIQVMVQDVKNAQERITHLTGKINLAKIEKNRLVRNLYIYETNHKKAQNIYVRPCQNGSCRGFLNTAWKCGICEKAVCSKCHEIKEDTEKHVCNEDNVKTAKMIETDSRPCPKCRAYIFKIDGCNQLWCVNCHTAFNWNTGCIIEDTRYFHNPHYFDWMKTQENGQDSGNDTGCSIREINSVFIILFTQKIFPLMKLHVFAYEQLDFFLREKCRKIVEIKIEVLPKYTMTLEKENEDLRMDYLKNKMDLKRFYDTISRRYTLQESKREYGQVLLMFVNSFTDIAFRLRKEVAHFIKCLETKPPEPMIKTRYNQRLPKAEYCSLTEADTDRLENRILPPFFQEFETLRVYMNECLSEIRRSFGLKREYYIDAERYEWKHKTICSNKQETPVAQPEELATPVEEK